MNSPIPRCPICKFPIREDKDVQACGECNTPYHAECWSGNGGCAIYGCKEVPVIEKQLVRATNTGWGDEKRCPECNSVIASSLLRCRCGAVFPWVEPMSSDQYRAWREREEKRKMIEGQLIQYFLGVFLVVLAPITAIAAWFTVRRHREVLIGAGGEYIALGYGTVILGVLYSLLFLALWVTR